MTVSCLLSTERHTNKACVCVCGCVIDQQRADLSAGLRRRPTRTLPHVVREEQSSFCFSLNPCLQRSKCRAPSGRHAAADRRQSLTLITARARQLLDNCVCLCACISSQQALFLPCRGADDSQPLTHESVIQFCSCFSTPL